MNIPAPNDENYQAEPPVGGCNEPFPSIQDQLAASWEHAFEADDTLDDYPDDDDDYDDEYNDQDDYDDEYSGSYAAGYDDGFRAGLRANSIKARLMRVFWPYTLRRHYYNLRWKLGKRFWNSRYDIPF